MNYASASYIRPVISFQGEGNKPGVLSLVMVTQHEHSEEVFSQT